MRNFREDQGASHKEEKKRTSLSQLPLEQDAWAFVLHTFQRARQLSDVTQSSDVKEPLCKRTGTERELEERTVGQNYSGTGGDKLYQGPQTVKPRFTKVETFTKFNLSSSYYVFIKLCVQMQ